MASTIDICNMALASIGQSQAIQDLGEASLAAQVCSLYYPTALDAVLRSAAWGFALAWVPLAQVAVNPTSDYRYAYQLPADCVATVRVLAGSGRVEAAPVVYRTARSSGGTILLTDQPAAVLQYVQRVTDPSVYPPDVVLALAHQLAALIAMPLSVARERRQDAELAARRQLALAVRANAGEGLADPAPDCEFIGVR